MAEKLSVKNLSDELQNLRAKIQQTELDLERKIEKKLEEAAAKLQSHIEHSEQAAAVHGMGIAAGERRRLIAEQAYLIAESRAFVGGDSEQDWLEAERQIDQMLLKGWEEMMPPLDASEHTDQARAKERDLRASK